MSGLIARTIDLLKERRQRILDGGINSIPSPFRRFSTDFIGIEQAHYTLLTSFTKVGKSMFASFTYLYTPLEYAYNNPDKLRLKIFYYNLEEKSEDIIDRYISYLLYVFYKRIIDPETLKSTANIPVGEDILDMISSDIIQDRLKFFEEHVIFSDSYNPTGLWKECSEYAKNNGKIHTEKYTRKDDLGVEHEYERFSHYEMDDPNEYRIIFYDNVNIVSTERGMDLRETINKLSEYFITLRNRYKFTIVAIQQQMMTGDDLEAFKAKKLRPSIQSLGDSKTTARDCDMMIGLFNPYRHDLPEYLGYNVRLLKDRLRFCEIIINRHGRSNGIVALYFRGESNFWKELPLPNTPDIEKVYQKAQESQKTNISLIVYSPKKSKKPNYLQKLIKKLKDVKRNFGIG